MNKFKARLIKALGGVTKAKYDEVVAHYDERRKVNEARHSALSAHFWAGHVALKNIGCDTETLYQAAGQLFDEGGLYPEGLTFEEAIYKRLKDYDLLPDANLSILDNKINCVYCTNKSAENCLSCDGESRFNGGVMGEPDGMEAPTRVRWESYREQRDQAREELQKQIEYSEKMEGLALTVYRISNAALAQFAGLIIPRQADKDKLNEAFTEINALLGEKGEPCQK